MDRDGQTGGGGDGITGSNSGRPRLSMWIWRPWYARLWWAAALLYWLGRLCGMASPALTAIYENAAAGYLNIVFFPPTLLVILGTGYVGAWMDHGRWESRDPAGPISRRRSVGGMNNVQSDPADPRSGSVWIGSFEKRNELLHDRRP